MRVRGVNLAADLPAVVEAVIKPLDPSVPAGLGLGLGLMLGLGLGLGQPLTLTLTLTLTRCPAYARAAWVRAPRPCAS